MRRDDQHETVFGFVCRPSYTTSRLFVFPKSRDSVGWTAVLMPPTAGKSLLTVIYAAPPQRPHSVKGEKPGKVRPDGSFCAACARLVLAPWARCFSAYAHWPWQEVALHYNSCEKSYHPVVFLCSSSFPFEHVVAVTS